MFLNLHLKSICFLYKCIYFSCFWCRATYSSRPSIIAAMPTLKQLQHYKENWVKNRGGGTQIQKLSELMEWAGGKTLLTQLQNNLPGAAGKTSFEDIFSLGQEFQFDPGSLKSTSEVLQAELGVQQEDEGMPWQMEMCVLPEGLFPEGVVVSSFQLLNTTLRSAMQLSKRMGRDSLGRLVVPVMMEIDGIHKLHHGRWVLIPIGTHTLRYDDDNKDIVQSFRLWAFLFCPSESAVNVEVALRSLKATSLMLWGEEFVAHCCCIDHSDGLRNGTLGVLPSCTMVTCWPHFARKVRENRGLIKCKGQKAEDFIVWTLDCLRGIHLAKTKDAAAHLGLEMLQEMMGKKENEFADWLLEEYFSSDWLIWFLTASGYPSALPSNQPIESNNKQIKTHKVNALRASTAYLLRNGLPRMIFLDGLDMAGSINVNLDFLAAGSIEGAAAVLMGPPNGEPFYTLEWEDALQWVDADTQWPEDPDDMQDIPLAYLLQHSVSVYLVNNSDNNHVNITWDRVRDFLDLLDGYEHHSAPTRFACGPRLGGLKQAMQ